jgi:hypothetical protein
MRKGDDDAFAADNTPEEDDPTVTAQDTVPDATSDPNVNNPNVSWDPGSDRPTSPDPEGYHWDDSMARYVANDPVAPAPTPTPETPVPEQQAQGAPSVPGPAPTVPLATPASAPSYTAPSAPSTYTPQATPPTVAPSANPNQPFDDSIRKSLLDAIDAAGKPVSASDPDLNPAILANKVSNERSLEQERNDIAERLGAQGLSSSGTLDQAMQAAREHAGAAEGTFAGGALMDAAKQRRAMLVSLLGQGSGVLTADEARQAQLKIADLDAFLREQSITNQNNQAYDQMGLSAAEYQAMLDRMAAMYLGG